MRIYIVKIIVLLFDIELDNGQPFIALLREYKEDLSFHMLKGLSMRDIRYIA